jgi:hypothetical protein
MIMTAETPAEGATERDVARLNAERAALGRHYCNTFSSGPHARYAIAGTADLTTCDDPTKVSTGP